MFVRKNSLNNVKQIIKQQYNSYNYIIWKRNFSYFEIDDTPDFEALVKEAQSRGAPVQVSPAYNNMMDGTGESLNPLQATADYQALIAGGLTPYVNTLFFCFLNFSIWVIKL